jgi:hypothetical protein
VPILSSRPCFAFTGSFGVVILQTMLLEAEAHRTGRFAGSDIDRRDGFIHFSRPGGRTAATYFSRLDFQAAELRRLVSSSQRDSPASNFRRASACTDFEAPAAQARLLRHSDSGSRLWRGLPSAVGRPLGAWQPQPQMRIYRGLRRIRG